MWILIFIILIFSLRLYLQKSVKKCVCSTSMEGKTVIVTGANGGIGYFTALKLAERGARVILACRNEERGNTTQKLIANLTGNPNVLFKQLNLSSLTSVRMFANDILASDYNIDVLINNAGACSKATNYTEDGLVEGMQVNHFGSFLLTLLLIPKLKASRPSRVVNTSSLIYIFGSIDINKINEPSYNRVISYANSKFCNLLFHTYLARCLNNTGISVNSIHPGIIRTNILSEANTVGRILFNILCWFAGRTAEDGAETVVHLSVSKTCENVTGKLFIDCKETYVLPKAKNEILAKKLWVASAKHVNYNEDLNVILNR